MSEYLVAMTTLSTEEDALRLAGALLERRLVACVNILPAARSLYRWQGELQDDREHVLILKTRADRFDALSKAFEELHPYDVPELIALPVVQGAPSYLGWLDACITGDTR